MCSVHRCGEAVRGKSQLEKKKQKTKGSSLNYVLKRISRLPFLCVLLGHIIFSRMNAERISGLIPPRV